MFGVSLGFIFTTIRLERISGIIILSILLAFVGVLYQDNNFSLNAAGNIPLSYWMLGISASTIIFILMGLIQFRNPDKLSIKNTFKNRYVTLRNLIKPKNNYTKIFLKNLIDIQRSAGGFLKIIFSASIIVITTFLLMYFMGRFFGLAAKEEFIYSSLFALITYPIYAILFRYDSIDTYSTLPISKNEVYLSKILFYTVIVLPLSLILYTAFVISNFDISLYVQGVIILFGLQYYQLGLLMYLGGDSPNRLLFDGVSFMIYSLATLLFMTPILIIGMYGILLPSAYITISTLLGLTASIIGCILIYSLFTNNTLDYL